MNAAIDVLKVRARVRLNAMRKAGGEGKLRDFLHDAAREVGFADWEHARRVLGGEAAEGEDMGTFWYSPATTTLLNEWFADAAAARKAHSESRGAFLLPYRRQFVLGQDAYIRELGLDPRAPAWQQAGHDLVAAYGSAAWAALAALRVRAPRSSFPAR
jgi:hypothetical protein